MSASTWVPFRRLAGLLLVLIAVRLTTDRPGPQSGAGAAGQIHLALERDVEVVGVVAAARGGGCEEIQGSGGLAVLCARRRETRGVVTRSESRRGWSGTLLWQIKHTYGQ